jgi:hypothetical protein
MKTFLLFLLVFVVGGVLGALGGGLFGVGAGAGVGIVTGLRAGACLTLEAARAEGLISADEEAGLLRPPPDSSRRRTCPKAPTPARSTAPQSSQTSAAPPNDPAALFRSSHQPQRDIP